MAYYNINMNTVESIIDKTVKEIIAASCQQCGRTFRKQSKLQRHIDQTHNNMRKFQCEVCQRLFKRKEQLKRHQVSHTHEKNYPCPECVMKFGYKHHMDRHVKLVHLKELYNCEQCHMQFIKKRSLAKHMKQHLQQLTRQSQKSDKMPDDQQTKSLSVKRMKRIEKKERKLWLCDRCNETFYKLISLRKHLTRLHPDRQPSVQSQVFLEDTLPMEKVQSSITGMGLIVQIESALL